MTTEEAVMRLNAKLASVERRSRVALITFVVPVSDEVDKLANQVGEACMLGVLLTHDPSADPDQT